MATLAHPDRATGPEAGFSLAYRIVTERKNVDEVKEWLVAHHFDYTIFYGDGAYHGDPEMSMSIELTNLSRSDAKFAALAIKEMNDQIAILLQEFPAVSFLL